MAVKKKKTRAAAKKKTRSVAKKKARSVAKKKTAARAKASGKKKPVALRPHTHRYKYFCQNNSAAAVPSSRRMKPGDTAIMKAEGTGATLDFGTASPFASGVTKITLASGGSQSELVGSTFGTFTYNVTCDECPSTVVLPPEMIVP
jgi:hypothetical protein